ncbi:unnamed protein product [marine sediment metagenome]|uniref:Helix-hairpin-helix DNA-binding motif class 1 domain-containing protein n=1 Tax=marine sediment metagenome TaxID=412755 RepID=X0Z8X1_9ZZZZ
MVTDNFIQRTDAGQKRIQSFAFVIGATAAVCFAIFFGILSLAGFGQSCEVGLESQINPNDVPMASLVRLPGIGITRAGAIVAYRENLAGQEGERRAFETIDDLQKVKGIGPKTAENIKDWLKFE